MAKSAWQERGRSLLEPAVGVLARAGVSPTAVTLAGLAITIASGILIGMGRPRTGGFVLLAAGVCDALDGQLARRTGRTSRFGAFLDSNIDRIDETAVLAGIAAYFQQRQVPYAEWMVLAAIVALAGSLLTSYARARAEGLGLECKVGMFERPERVVVVAAGLLLGERFLAGAVIVVLVLSWVTVLQRILHVRRVLAEADAPPRRG
jgi:CDP-diacylglycerol--glycerol-3-phosphate 3-phosphatidyltransferase